jgi:hypothetical protein
MRKAKSSRSEDFATICRSGSSNHLGLMALSAERPIFFGFRRPELLSARLRKTFQPQPRE